MSSRGKSFLQRWAVNTLGVVVAANVIHGIGYESVPSLLLASLLLGVLNAFVRPLLIFFALPLLILTLGLFILVINGFLLYAVGGLLKGFHVDSFRAAFLGALVISLVSMLANWLLGGSDVRVRAQGGGRPRRPPGDGQGPIIDV